MQVPARPVHGGVSPSPAVRNGIMQRRASHAPAENRRGFSPALTDASMKDKEGYGPRWQPASSRGSRLCLRRLITHLDDSAH